MKATQIRIESGCDYLGQSKVLKALPVNGILDKGKVGCGGTTLAIESKDKYVVCVPFVSMIENKVQQYPNERYSGEAFGFFSGVLKRDLEAYLDRVEIPKIIVTYDSLEKLTKWINSQDYKILIDELHLLFTEYSYRHEAVKGVLRSYTNYREFCFMTATPLESEFLLDELTHLPVFEAVWDNTKEVTVQSVRCVTSVMGTVAQLVNEFLEGKYSGNAYFFVNSVQYIKKLIDECSLDDSTCRAIYSKNNKTALPIKRGTTLDRPKKINFVTSTAFEGSDIYDENGVTFIISDSAETQTLIDISTKFQQIAGRIRDSKYSNTIYHIYKLTRYSDLSYDEFKKYTEETIEDSKQFLADTSGKRYATKITPDQLYVRKEGNQFILDSNMLKIDLYQYKICRSIYSLRVNLLNEYEKNGYKADFYDHIAENIITKDRSKSNFKEMVLEVEKEQANKYRLSSPITAAAYEKYPFLKEAIEKLGFEEMAKLKYVITHIKEKLIGKSDLGNEAKIYRLLSTQISSGDFYPSATLKLLMAEVYSKLGLAKTAKGTDITNYFEVKESKRNIDGKSTRGYTIVRSKMFFAN